MDPRTSLNQIKRTWHPPGELERSRPREVCLTGAGKALAGLTIAMLLGGFIAGLSLYANASWEEGRRAELIKSGMDTEAWITRRWTSGRNPVHYWAEYAYRVGKRTYRGRLSMGRNFWQDLESMRTLGIRYLPADPQRHMVRGREAALLPAWVSISAAAGPFFVAGMLALLLKSQRCLLAEGRPAPAVVARVTRSNQQHAKKVAHYAFMSMSGKLINGKSGPQKHPPEVGSVLNVIYEPDRERHNSIYPLPLVKTKRLGIGVR